MAVTARYLIDTSAAARNRQVAAKLTPLIEAALVTTCATLDAEALYSARSPAEYEQRRTDRREAYEYLPKDDTHWHQAFKVQRELARTGRHRAVGIADLFTAVLAADHGVTVLHYHADFEVTAEVLEFQHCWVSARGTA